MARNKQFTADMREIMPNKVKQYCRCCTIHGIKSQQTRL